MAATNWTFNSTASDGTVTTLRVATSDTTARSDWDGNGATFDPRGRLATYPVWYAAYDDASGTFITSRATVRVRRDYWGKVTSYEAMDDFGADVLVSARTRADVRALLGNAAIEWVMTSLRKSRRAA